MGLASFRRLIACRQLAGLLALALWLPAAQWVAATHALLHLHASVSEEADRPSHLPQSCETCVVAATILGSAPAGAPGGLPPSAAMHARPLSPAPREIPARACAGYRSRAPPLLHA